MGFKKFFDSYMQNYEGKLKMIRRNRFDTDCENGRAFFPPVRLASQALFLKVDEALRAFVIPTQLLYLVAQAVFSRTHVDFETLPCCHRGSLAKDKS